MSLPRHARAIAQAWRAESARRRQLAPASLDAEFLPAALEVAERPPSPLGRAILWSIVAAALLALAWASFASVDTVAVAEGRLTPSGRLRAVQPAEAGIVREVAVREGDHVAAGQVLIALDPTLAQADVQAAQADLQTASLARARASALLTGGATGLKAPAGAAPLAVEAEREAVEARRKELDAKVAGLEERRAAALASVRASEAAIAKYQQTLPLAERQVRAYQTLADKGFGSVLRLGQEQERYVGMLHDLDVEKAHRDEAQAQAASLNRELAEAVAEFRSTAAKERAEAEGEVETRREALRKAQQRGALQVLRAPVGGTIQEVSVTTLGQVVETGKPLVTLVPENEPLVVEAMLLNRDAGAVKAGDRAVVKLEAYPFTRYGTLIGRVTHISPDAIVDDKRGLVFAATIAFDPAPAQRRRLRLSAGMTASVEVVTGRRRVIEYLWSPVARAVAEAGRER